MEGQKFSFEKLNDKNFETWSLKIKAVLINSDLWEFVNSDCPAPIEETAKNAAGEDVITVKNEKEISTWMSKDQKAFSNLILSVDDSQLQLIKKCTTSKSAWNELKSYHQKSTLSNKVSLLKQACKMQLREGDDMGNHIFKMEEIFDKLANLGKNLEEDLRVAIILSSLPESYNTLITALEARDEKDLTMALVKSKLGRIRESSESCEI